MTDPAKIRNGLKRVARERKAALGAHREATAELRRLLKDAQGTEGLTMAEAAELAEISRKTAYAMLDELERGAG